MKVLGLKEKSPKTVEAFACPCLPTACGCTCGTCDGIGEIRVAVLNGVENNLMNNTSYGTQTAFY